ncbi:hypothetical protein NLJ89_g2209 [Agrocybe chaxingu]|uniref:Uncharacterized protein n=1 Tax=Agrocybe chaxingu TaxID=84603 RepID=A0A9W8MYX5_9AGAR|nr:hypothetical protein NLJ89_g2209 [Agrocybe chaxingu]
MQHTKTKSESLREKTLLADPLASLLDPYQVLCKQCGGTIQLSKKAAYDLFHWKNHRKRCNRKLKTTKGKKPKVTKATKSATHCPPASPVANMPLKPEASTSSPFLSGRSLRTPPLVSDSDEDPDLRSERSSEVHSPAMPSRPIPTQSPPPISRLSLDPVETYMSRSHRGYVHRSPGLPAETWKNWSWSQLKEPQFAVGDREDVDLEIEEDERSERDVDFFNAWDSISPRGTEVEKHDRSF